MNIILLQEQDFVTSTEVCVGGLRSQHIRSVLRAGIGGQLKIGVLNRQLGSGRVTAITSNTVTMSVELNRDPPPPSPVSLVLALPRPKVLKRIFRMVAELGIKQLTLLNSCRVEKSYWQSPVLAQDKIEACFKLGLAQAGDTIIPEVKIEKRFKPFVEDRLATLLAGSEAYVAHPACSNEQHARPAGNILLTIGPEGGFIPYEIDKLRAQGLRLLNLGERILRVETAVPFAVAALIHSDKHL